MSKIVDFQVHKEKISKKRSESFWYHGEHVATATNDAGLTFIAECTGEQQGQLEKNGTVFCGHDLVTEAYNLKLKDKDIQKQMSKDRFRYNNWFVVREMYADGNISDDLDVQGDYDSILSSLKEIAETES